MAKLLGVGRRSLVGRASTRSWLSTSSSSSSSTVVAASPSPSSYPGWRVLEERRVAEFNIDATFLVHEKTKARYLHMAAEDDNNAFSVNFRTTPMDSTGVAHILEHTALCGSRRFPVRDPFMKMLNRSLSTFMNAMTGPDYTLYPFSTCNRQDFYNLMSVYLDSVFHPLLREQDFLQEGWRLEPDDLQDLASPLVIKGVVYNEMKGAYANSQAMFGQLLLNHLCPSHTYGHSSGGLPLAIPGLSWEGLKAFHAAHYHPSNCRMLSYGNLPLGDHLAKVDSEYLTHFEHLQQDTSVPAEPRWSSPRRLASTCAPDPMNPDPTKQASVAVSYLLSDITDLKSSFALQVLSELLMSGPASPFYRALIESGLGSTLSPASGFEDHVRETNLTIGLQNVAEGDVDEVVRVIEATLERAAEEGFEQEKVEAVLHSYELSLKHKSANFGMNLIMSMTPYWNHAESPLDFLEVNRTIKWFRATLAADPSFLQDLVRSHLLENSHKLVQTMVPDARHQEREDTSYMELEESLREGLGEGEDEVVKAKALELAKAQDEVEDASCLPSLRVADIPLTTAATDLTHLTLAGTSVQLAVQPTNEVSYFRALLDTSGVPSELRPLLPVFASVLTRLGAAHLDFRQLDTEAELRTGGLSASMHVQEDKADLSAVTQGVLLSSHCLDRNIPAMLELWRHVFTSVHWKDTARLATLVRMSATNANNGLPGSGHRYAMAAAAASLGPASALAEQFSGMTHLHLLNRLAQEDAERLVPKLQRIAAIVLGGEAAARVALNSSNPEVLVPEVESFLGAVGTARHSNFITKSSGEFGAASLAQHFVTSFPINFTSLAVPTVPYTSPDHAPLKVLSGLLSAKYLHSEIREKGGAYGGGAMAGPGAFTYYSYRDPNNLETFSVYSASTDWVLGGAVGQAEVDEALLRVFQGVDAPVAPGYRGLRPFLSGITDADFAEHRSRLRAVTVTDVRDVAQRYLREPEVCGKALIGGANRNLDELGWKVHQMQNL